MRTGGIVVLILARRGPSVPHTHITLLQMVVGTTSVNKHIEWVEVLNLLVYYS